MHVQPNYSLSQLNSFGFEARARQFLVIEQVKDLDILIASKELMQLPRLILGGGSNLLFCSNFEGLVLHPMLMGRNLQSLGEDYHLHVGAGENWHQLVQWCVEQGIGGLENLALIPGNCGAAPVQNIGAYGVEFQSICAYVDTYNLETGEQQRFTQAECEFAYRNSIFKHRFHNTHMILAIGLKLPKQWQPKLHYGPLAELAKQSGVTPEQVFDRVCDIRKSKLPDPAKLGNAGSFFKNPVIPVSQAKQLLCHYPDMPTYPAGEGMVKVAAGWLIDQTGLKGMRYKCVGVHQQQALVLVHFGQGSPKQLLQLAAHVRSTVNHQFGIELEHEVRFIGSLGETSLTEQMKTLDPLT